MSLNFATQFLPKSAQVREIMDNAAIHAFFPLDDRTAASAAKLLNIDPQALTLLETGECYIKERSTTRTDESDPRHSPRHNIPQFQESQTEIAQTSLY